MDARGEELKQNLISSTRALMMTKLRRADLEMEAAEQAMVAARGLLAQAVELEETARKLEQTEE